MQSDIPLPKRITCRTSSTAEESQLSALMEADISQIVDAVKKGFSEFAASTQISDTLPTDQRMNSI